MKRVNVIGLLLLLTCFFVACSEREDEIVSVSKKNAGIEKPEGGFLLNCEHANGMVDVITGIDFKDFVRFRTKDKDSIIADFNVLYAYEDIGDIIISDKEDDRFILNAFGDEFQVYDIKDIKNEGIKFNVTRKDGEVLVATLYLNSLNKAEWFKELYSLSVVPNPFNNASGEKIGNLAIALIGAGAVIVAAVITVTADYINDMCQNKRDIDRHNCEHSSKKCLKANGRCHYTCIPCKK